MSSYPQLEIKLIDGNRTRTKGDVIAEKPLPLRAAAKPDGGAILRLVQRLTGELVADVPAAYGVCEFDCRKLQCSRAEWATCARRLAEAEGELWPSSPDGIGDRTRAVG